MSSVCECAHLCMPGCVRVGVCMHTLSVVQVESVKKGGPYVMFGDGHLAACKPISEEDLAKFIGDCVTQSDKINQACVPLLSLPLHPTSPAYLSSSSIVVLILLNDS
jgi:hypothetical protein